MIPDTLFKDKSEALWVMESEEESQGKYPPRKEIYSWLTFYLTENGHTVS